MKLDPKKLSFWFKALSSVLAVAYVGYELYRRRGEVASMWLDPWGWQTYLLLFTSIALMPLNYALEARKWQLVVRPFYPSLRLNTALYAVFAGMASGIWTPNRIGEYAGRVIFLKEGSRFEAVIATFLDRICQLLVTLVSGLFALVSLAVYAGSDVLLALLGSQEAIIIFSVMSAAMAVVVIVFLAAPKHMSGLLPNRWNSAAWIRKLKFAFTQLPWQQLVVVLGLSALRYAVFSSQYVLLMYAFGYDAGLILAYGIVAMIFLGKSVLPVMGIFELGIREWVAVMVMGVFMQSSPMAVSSTFILYVVNILLPTLIGVLMLQRASRED